MIDPSRQSEAPHWPRLSLVVSSHGDPDRGGLRDRCCRYLGAAAVGVGCRSRGLPLPKASLAKIDAYLGGPFARRPMHAGLGIVFYLRHCPRSVERGDHPLGGPSPGMLSSARKPKRASLQQKSVARSSQRRRMLVSRSASVCKESKSSKQLNGSRPAFQSRANLQTIRVMCNHDRTPLAGDSIRDAAPQFQLVREDPSTSLASNEFNCRNLHGQRFPPQLLSRKGPPTPMRMIVDPLLPARLSPVCKMFQRESVFIACVSFAEKPKNKEQWHCLLTRLTECVADASCGGVEVRVW